ncbi:hypothetical protein Mgra_00006093 [Meloidogyne graminicola]|uniref:Fe2OG dioxygenase domain-containing protein n=1 Tax=Meloidogyne graminicola TaxID=189291 RepID=A0A8S9ZMT6_9BILA|nr:hypothetical protein Mgra_00006093 [Meloidogyne graminicola]
MYQSTSTEDLTDSSYSEFKKLFKFYKRRDHSLDLSAFFDPHKYSEVFNLKLNYVSDKCLIAVEKIFKTINGLRPINQWTLTTFLHRPGLFIIGGVLTIPEQLKWIERCLLEYSEPPNITNLFVQSNNPYKGPNVFKNNSKKLRWVTLGNDYNWDTKEYDNLARQPLPVEMVKLSQLAVYSIGLNNFFPDAAIINFYPQKSYLSPHVDRSERDLTHPLVSISLGQPTIYLTGGTSLNDPVDALLLRSGDILIMSGEQRLVYHAVPRILEGNEAFNEEYIQMVKEKEILDYANNCRINISVRQVDN